MDSMITEVFNPKIKSYQNSGFIFNHGFFENFESAHTQRAYRQDLRLFLEKFLVPTYGELPPKRISSDHILAYRKFLEIQGGARGSPAANKTIVRKLACLKSYFDYLIRKKIIADNPAAPVFVKRPKDLPQKETLDLADQQVKDLLRSIPVEKYMHKALLIFMFSTGMRQGEILKLRLADYQEKQGFKVISFRGKGGKYHEIPLHPACIEFLHRYFDWMKSQGRKLKSNDFIFQPTKNPRGKILGQEMNKPLTPMAIRNVIQFYCRKIGIKDNITPHSARATVIGSLLESGVDLYRVSKMVNHSSVRTTQKYDKRKRKLSDSPVYKLAYFD